MSGNKAAILLLCIVAWGLMLVINVQFDARRSELFVYSEYRRRAYYEAFLASLRVYRCLIDPRRAAYGSQMHSGTTVYIRHNV